MMGKKELLDKKQNRTESITSSFGEAGQLTRQRPKEQNEGNNRLKVSEL